MSYDVVVQANQQMNPFQQQGQDVSPGAMNVGAVSIEQKRAITEAQGQLGMAKMFPRDLNQAHAELMRACKSRYFAETAFYTLPRGGQSITGPSIRLAEEIARCVGNFQYGHRELSRDDKKSEVEIFAWDMEKNNRRIRQITVDHVRYSKGGGNQPLRDPKDIDDKISNVASKQVRGLVLALLPKWLVEEAIIQCQETLEGNGGESVEQRILKMTKAFDKQGISVALLERYLGHALKETVPSEITELMGVYNALKEGVDPREYFGAPERDEKDAQASDAVAAINKAAAAATAPQEERPSAIVADISEAKAKRQPKAKPDTQPEVSTAEEEAPGPTEEAPEGETVLF